MSDEVDACPNCNRASIAANSNNPFGGPNAGTKYTCQKCYHKFDTPVTRERQHESGLAGVARRLADADPDEVSAP